MTDEVAAFELFTPQMLVTLGEKGVKTLDDLADLAGDELIEILGADAVDEATANEVIMAARAHWFADEAAPTSEEPVSEEGEAEKAAGDEGGSTEPVLAAAGETSND